ncbi:MAG TPA: hypothetical protein VFD58_29355 [Blastocatellia bacterium]|nr:hypothetical protein [Blastocatellia bacterium]
MVTVLCQRCESVYELSLEDSAVRESGTVACDVCGHRIPEGGNAAYYRARLVSPEEMKNRDEEEHVAYEEYRRMVMETLLVRAQKS